MIMGDRQVDSLQSLWEKYGRYMLAVANRCCASPDEADDVVQNVVVRLAGQADRIVNLPDMEIRKYLARAVRNEAINRGLFNKKQIAVTDTISSEAAQNKPDSTNTEETVILREEIRKVQTLISRLPAAEQQALRMKKVSNATDAEIAEAIGISENSVSQYVRRAQKKLLVMYQEEEAER
ncbi:MAG: sigma-70 family RNA polymerase sigma factor [Clostridia bacterium]|nr:sigma-70 family RNA polymerase sigma factor [Clostridia bacterium]